jgi:exonuclease III
MHGEDLTIPSLNINRLQNKLSLLENFLASLSKNDKTLDVIFLCETSLTTEITQFFNIEGYNAFHFTRENREGGGLVFYVKKVLRFISRSRNFSTEKFNFSF